MKILACIIIGIALVGGAAAQSLTTIYRKKLFMKVTTDDHIYKGRLYYVGDSSIRVIRAISYKDLPVRVAVQDILQISFKRKNALIKNIIEGIAVGAVGGGWLPSKLSSLGVYVSDRVLLYGMVSGAALGFVIGALTAPIVRINIQIHKSQRLFEENRSKLKSLSVY